MAAAPAMEWQSAQGYRSLAVTPGSLGKDGFTLLTASTAGIAFTNTLSEQRHLTNQILLNGSGVAAGDVDGDGWTDLYFCGLDAPNSLYRNLGNWKFEDISSVAGVQCPDILATGAAFADLDGDGDLDLVVNSVGQGSHIFHNNGGGQFTKAALINEGRGGMSLALGDLDRDGFLDIYIANYRTLGLMDIPNARATFKTIGGKSYVESFNGRPTTSPDLTNRFSVGPLGGIEENGEPDLVLRNIGGTNFVPMPLGKFLDETGQPLASDLFDWGLAVAIRDINGDNRPDIYVCNDFQTEDRFWIQQTNGTFRLASPLAQRKASLFSMAVDFADINRDGYDDFLLADMLSRDHSQRMRDMPDQPPLYFGQIENRPQYSLNTLFLNRGDTTYSEVARLSRLQASEWSWSCIFLDVDLDGWEDVLMSNGMERAARDLDIAAKIKTMRATRRVSDAEIFRARKEFPRLATANLAFRNKHDLTFEDASEQWNFNLAGISHGMALADLDNDGDLDVAINNLNAPAAIYRNESAAPRVAVRLKGSGPNTHGVGAKVRVQAQGLPRQAQEIMAGGRYLSSDDSVRTFAAGQSSEVAIEVQWPNGKTASFTGLKPNRIYELEESAAQTATSSVPAKSSQPLFEDVSHLLSYSHAEEPFDDFARQPLLPRKFSQPGPVAAWVDLDSDGWQDLVIGPSRNQPLAVFRNNQKGGFERLNAEPFSSPPKRDVTGIAALSSTNITTLLVALSNYEDGLTFGPAISAFQTGAKAPTEIASSWDSSIGAIALADIDGDGDQDLFAAGAVIPGRYPAPAASRLFRNENGKFLPIDSPVFREVGLVNSALFADFDQDSDPDLLLACEWGSVRLFPNEKGTFTDATKRVALDRYLGLWNGLAPGDFDKDGRIDFVASNWGRNTKYEPFRQQPLKIFYGDFDEDGTFDLIESHFESALSKYVPDRHLGAVGGAISFVNDRFRSNLIYSKAGIEQVLGEQFSRAKSVEANWMENTVFLNRGDRFEARPLPIDAQFSPAFGVCAGDFDGDSHPDIVLAQNFFALEPNTPRYDAGRSLLLKGDGKGDFTAVPGQVSGLLVYGEQRSVAAADYDKDGQLDLVITQNGAPVKLFRNLGPK